MPGWHKYILEGMVSQRGRRPEAPRSLSAFSFWTVEKGFRNEVTRLKELSRLRPPLFRWRRRSFERHEAPQTSVVTPQRRGPKLAVPCDANPQIGAVNLVDTASRQRFQT